MRWAGMVVALAGCGSEAMPEAAPLVHYTLVVEPQGEPVPAITIDGEPRSMFEVDEPLFVDHTLEVGGATYTFVIDKFDCSHRAVHPIYERVDHFLCVYPSGELRLATANVTTTGDGLCVVDGFCNDTSIIRD